MTITAVRETFGKGGVRVHAVEPKAKWGKHVKVSRDLNRTPSQGIRKERA
jgi:hypothetical protein